MPRGHPGLPETSSTIISKGSLLRRLKDVDDDSGARGRVLEMEIDFRERIENALRRLPIANSKFDDFRTSPFVLLQYAKLRDYTHVKQIEGDIPIAKLFSSMETSSGRMIEEVALPIYRWQTVASQMHTEYSAIDGKFVDGNVLRLATLKSGPRCLNDEMAENFADQIISHAPIWAENDGVSEIDFTYGVLYGTYKQSNKKDWHILRNIYEKLDGNPIEQSPYGNWSTTFRHKGVKVSATVRIGTSWWDFLGSTIGAPHADIEIWTSLIRACIAVDATEAKDAPYLISDMSTIASGVPDDYNVSLLQSGQLPWLFLIARHFCENLVE